MKVSMRFLLVSSILLASVPGLCPDWDDLSKMKTLSAKECRRFWLRWPRAWNDTAIFALKSIC